MLSWLVLTAICATSFAIHWQAARRRFDEQLETEDLLEALDHKTECVLNVLIVWAQTWGREPREVARYLSEVLHAYGMDDRPSAVPLSVHQRVRAH